MSDRRLYNLSSEEAIDALRNELVGMRAAENRAELDDVDADTAYELGYETAIHEFARMTGPDPREIGIITYELKDAE